MTPAGDPPPDEPSSDGSIAPAGRFAHPLVVALLGLCAALSLVGRFVISTPLWLDEALSVNISRLPIGEIPAALRRDGHPPLYYVLLHGWMELFGTGDGAVRAFSGIVSLALIPLAWLVGRRIGTPRLAATLALVVTVSPYVLRYASETRMYVLVMTMVLVGYLAVDAALDRSAPASLFGVAAMTAALLWTHYWSMWLLATVAGVTAWIAVRRRRDDPGASRRAWRVLGAIALGGAAFAPWLPTLAYQSEHTGTPWAKAFRPATLIITSLTEFGGGPYGETQVLSVMLVVLAFVGVTGVAVDRFRIDIDLRGRPDARRPLLVLIGTAGIASVVGLATGMAFHPRYAAVFYPLVAILIALGIDRFAPGMPRDVMLAGFAVLSAVGLVVVITNERSQSAEIADAIARLDGAALVVTCPDQLGPTTERAVSARLGNRAEVVAYPRLDDPRRIDWVDYAPRNARNQPEAIAARVLERAGDRTVVVVFGDDYRTLEGQCGRLITELSRSRPATQLVRSKSPDVYEPAAAVAFPPAPGA